MYFIIYFAAGKLYNRLKPVVRLSFFRMSESADTAISNFSFLISNFIVLRCAS